MVECLPQVWETGHPGCFNYGRVSAINIYINTYVYVHVPFLVPWLLDRVSCVPILEPWLLAIVWCPYLEP